MKQILALSFILLFSACSKNDSTQNTATNNVPKQVDEKIVDAYEELSVGLARGTVRIDTTSVSMVSEVGTSVTQQYYVYSNDRGTFPLGLNLSTPNPDLSVSTDCPDPLTRGTKCYVTLTWNPTAAVSNQTATMDLMGELITIDLSATEPLAPGELTPEQESKFRISPLAIDFGEVEGGNTVTKTISVTNLNRDAITPLLTGLTVFTVTDVSCGGEVTRRERCLLEVSYTAPDPNDGTPVNETLNVTVNQGVTISATPVQAVDPNACIPSDKVTFGTNSYDLTNTSPVTVRVTSTHPNDGKVCVVNTNDPSQFTITGCESPIRFRGSCNLTISHNNPSASVEEQITLNENPVTLIYTVPNTCVVPTSGTTDPVTGIDNTNSQVQTVYESGANCLVQRCNDTSFEVAGDGKSCVAAAPASPTYDSGLQYDSGVTYQ